MQNRRASVFALGVVTASTLAAFSGRSPAGPPDPDLTVHEWGTFTSVAGANGHAIEWLPLGGPTDLPCFVEHLGGLELKVLLGPGESPQLNYESARAALWGKVRMETPVLYFYSARDVSLYVGVQFPRGLITEWYPRPSRFQLGMTATTLRRSDQLGFVEWRDVKVGPSVRPDFLKGEGESHYYAARATDATPLRVGDQNEKFLFYRGVASFDVPITAAALDNGGVRVANINSFGALPNVVLFENRGGKIGYRINGALVDSATIAAPSLDGSLPALRAGLVAMLIKAGLNQKEAAAMVETWRDSWFEEGTRVFYILPARAVDAILPLTIEPTPGSVARVFVGRMEVITPATIQVVSDALASNDTATLLRYSRFLSPITDRIVAKGVDPMTSARIHQVTDAVFASYVGRAKSCQ